MELQEEDKPDIRKIVFVGLDNAGKTSIVLSLLREISKFAVIKPTRNAERRTFEFLGMEISEWDLGGHERYRILYLEQAELIFRRTDILIYVVDITDYARITESFGYLKDLIDKLTDMRLKPPIHIFFHKNDPAKAKSLQIKINDSITFLKAKIRDFQNQMTFFFHKTTVFDMASIINAMSEILLSLFPRSKLIDSAIQEFVNKCGVEGVELIDDNSLIIGSFYKNEITKKRLNSLSPYFLRLNDEFNKIDAIEIEEENHIIVERFGIYFIFKQFMLNTTASPYYILISTHDPFLDKDEFNALVNILRDIISQEV